MCLIDTNIVIYGQKTWAIFNLKVGLVWAMIRMQGKLVEKRQFEGDGEILSLRMLDTLDSFSMITWSGDLEKPRMVGYTC